MNDPPINDDGTVTWPTSISTIRRSLTLLKLAAAFVLLEQAAEVLVFHVRLAEHPALIIAALGALGVPVPVAKDKSE